MASHGQYDGARYRDDDTGGYTTGYEQGGYDSHGAAPGSHELDDFYTPEALPAPYRLSILSNSSNDFRRNSSGTGSNPNSRPHSMANLVPVSAAGGAAYAPLERGESDIYSKEAFGADRPASYYDPQRSGAARFQARQQQAVGAGGAGGYGYAAGKAGMSKRKKGLIAGAVALVVVAIVVGVAVGVSMGKKSSRNTSSTNSAANGGSTSSDGSSGGSNSTAASSYANDSRLHQSFWGIAYTPQSALLPWCGATQANVTRDIVILSQLTKRLRLYGANCNQTALVLQAIKDLGVDMEVAIAIYIDTNTQAFNDQLTSIEDALKTYGTDHVSGITVGNEYVLNAITPSSDMTTAAALAAVKTIKADIQTVNTTVKALNLNKHLPIGTSDAGSAFDVNFAEGMDYFQANVHPWFATVGVDEAAAWTWQFFQDFDVDIAAQATNKPATYIAETGWPTKSMNASLANNGAASPGGDASVANLQTFLDTFVCQANANGTQYYYFEAFDEPWKEQFFGVEPYWGIFDSERNLKDVTVPNCQTP